MTKKKFVNLTLNKYRWEDIKSDLEQKIIEGKYTVGDKIPTIMQLMAEYSVSRTTISKVFREMKNADIILPKGKKGCLVMPYAKERILQKRKTKIKNDIIKMVEIIEKQGISKKECKEIIIQVLDRI